jgi:hypothetical protein
MVGGRGETDDNSWMQVVGPNTKCSENALLLGPLLNCLKVNVKLVEARSTPDPYSATINKLALLLRFLYSRVEMQFVATECLF